MAYSKELADRVRKILSRHVDVKEKAMFGGLSFLLNGKMVCGVLKEDLVVRVDPKESEKLLKEKGARPMDFTGRPMKGFLYVNSVGTNTGRKLSKWIKRSLDFVSLTLPQQNKRRR